MRFQSFVPHNSGQSFRIGDAGPAVASNGIINQLELLDNGCTLVTFDSGAQCVITPAGIGHVSRVESVKKARAR